MEQWLEVTIRTASGGIDLLCAELTETGFDSFRSSMHSEQFPPVPRRRARLLGLCG